MRLRLGLLPNGIGDGDLEKDLFLREMETVI